MFLAACGPEPDGRWAGEERLGFDEFAVKTVCPQSGALTLGIDVSKWQSTIDWAAVKKAGKVKFAITRASHGINVIDGKFSGNFKGILAQGLVRGVYQYFEPGQDAIQQADLMLKMISDAGGLLPTDLPPVLDLETTSGQTPAVIQQRARAWLERVEAKTGKKPLVYTAAYFAQSNLGSALKDYPVWIANYKYTTTGACPLMPNTGWSKWSIWQYSDQGSVSGIGGNVDMNVFDGTLSELKAFAAGSTAPPPPPPPPGDSPKLTMKISIESIAGQPRDGCEAQQSAGIFDWKEGQATEIHVDIKNNGPVLAKGLLAGMWIEEPYLLARKWNIYSDRSGSFQLDDADKTQTIPHVDPGQRLELLLESLSVGETKRVVLFVEAARASLGLAEHAEVRAWVKHVDSWYDKADFDSAPQNAGGSQTFNGGDLRVKAQSDVLGSETCGDGIDNDCDGEVDDGCAATDAGGENTTPYSDAGVAAEQPSPRPVEGCAVAGASSGSRSLGLVLLLLGAALLCRRRKP